MVSNSFVTLQATEILIAMKAKITIACWLMLLLLAASCTKGPAAFKGDYSFKTGGYLTVSGTVSDLLGQRDTTFIRHLVPESGQMHVVREEGDRMVVTMNITGGDPVVFPATVDGSEIILEPVLHSLLLRPAIGDETVRQDFMVSGTGRKYDRMILFELECEGTFRHLNLDGEVSESEIKCIATENE